MVQSAEQIEPNLASVDLVLTLMEVLAASPRPRGVSEIARELGLSKARAHRHLRALTSRGYVRQDPTSERYEIAIKLMILGEAVRDRFDVLTAMRPAMAALREATGQAVTASALIEDKVVVLELLPGRNPIEFGVRPGTTLDFHATAHGHIALAFGPPRLMNQANVSPLKAWTAATITDPERLAEAVAQARRQGWAGAPDQMMLGVNALAAPVFDHLGNWRGTIALVGSTQAIAACPAAEQIRQLTAAAAQASTSLGWRERAA
ncbi:MAG TPA: IclR family transcriptional regulator [Caulobacteraceae bacterium]